MPPSPPRDEPAATEACPGCGAVLAQRSDDVGTHPGASPSCARLFAVTLRGLREDAGTDASAAVAIGLADAAYDVQHPVVDEPGRASAALDRLAVGLGVPLAGPPPAAPPAGWTTTIADVAADLDVIDLGVLVGSWARAVLADRTGPSRP